MRANAKVAFIWGTRLVVGLVLLQVLLAGIGIFADASFLFWHAAVNSVAVFAVPLLLAGLGWYAGVPRKLILWCAAIAGLVILQSILLVPYHMDAPPALRAIAGLHVVNALAIFWVSLHVLDMSRDLEPAAARAALASGGDPPVAV